MYKPLVTVVTPSFNQGHFIRATIESVLSQDYPNVEYIIMDGGSTDQTAAIVGEYSSRVRFISERDRGQSHAINKGFKLASGSIVAWLNSDDIFLPGAISAAANAFTEKPDAGAVYGEGFLIDREGKITSRFPHTEPLNLWRLVYLSDYILQQTVFFRKEAVEAVGYLDEDLHYVMDWDLLIRLGKRYPLEYIPNEMGCLREYAEAKSFAGGIRRADEIRRMLRKHTGMRYPFGYIVYGLDTYHQVWCQQVDQAAPEFLKPVSQVVQKAIRLSCGLVIGHTVMHSQGLYLDRWAAPRLRYMLAPGRGPIVLEGTVPSWLGFSGAQALKVSCNGVDVGTYRVDAGDFQLVIELPEYLDDVVLNFVVQATRHARLGKKPFQGDRRRVAYLFRRMCRGNEFGLKQRSPEVSSLVPSMHLQ